MASQDHAPNTCAATEKEPLPQDTEFQDFTANWCSLSAGEVREYGYRMGHIVTTDGIVGLYDQTTKCGSDPYTRLDVVANGRVYSASWRRLFTDRYLKTLAKRFAAKVAREHSSPRPTPELGPGTNTKDQMP